VWSGASLPSHRVIACPCGPLSASARGTPSAICSAANESSVVSSRGFPASGSQYARLSPTQPTTRSGPSSTAATNVQDAGLPRPAVVWATTASLAASAAAPSASAVAVARVAGVPIACGSETASTSRAARAAARLATSESVDVETPSQTTSTAWPPGSASAWRAMASSFRECRMPRSQTPATHGAGCSVKWLRGLAALAPHCVQ
jgi:hypothetical protein